MRAGLGDGGEEGNLAVLIVHFAGLDPAPAGLHMGHMTERPQHLRSQLHPGSSTARF